MLKIKEAIVVEGRYDKIALEPLVDTAIFTTDGFGIFKNKEKLALLRRVAEQRGLIVLTDADGAVLASFTPEKAYSSVVISAPGMESGGTYSVACGSESRSVTLDGFTYSEGGFGGFGGGMPGGMGGAAFNGPTGARCAARSAKAVAQRPPPAGASCARRGRRC